jgi:hypothetical protein
MLKISSFMEHRIIATVNKPEHTPIPFKTEEIVHFQKGKRQQ